MEAPAEIQMTEWVKRGIMLVRRDALDGDDPGHPYNYIRATYGVAPEQYGIRKPSIPPARERLCDF